MWAGEFLRLAARRFLRDLERATGARPPFLFSAREAFRYCDFIEQLPHVEGEWDTPTIQLDPSQCFFLVQLFGFRNLEGGRRFSEALYCVARKNAKSTLAAAILLACMCLEKLTGPQLISAATTGDQAKIVWEIARKMVNRTPALQDAFDVEALARTIVRAEVGGIFKAINAKASTQDGLNPSHTNTDEIHAHKTHDLINVLRSAAGARKNPLWLYTTTEGYINAGPWSEIRSFGIQILRGLFRADHFLVVIYAIDEKDDTFDASKWIKANPLMVANPILAEELRKLAINARAMPGAQGEFEIKRCNRSAATASGFVNMHKWKRTDQPVPVEMLVREGAPCFGAFDLASTIDMAAAAYLWFFQQRFYLKARFWVPEEAVRIRTERRSVPYAGWVKGGWVTQTPGEAIDYEIVQADLLADARNFGVRKIGYDPWNAQAVAAWLVNEGLELEQFRQGTASYQPAVQAFEVAYVRGMIAAESNPVLRWNMANLVMRTDVNMNKAPDRKRSAEKIDGAVSTLMAFGLAVADDSVAFDTAISNPVSA